MQKNPNSQVKYSLFENLDIVTSIGGIFLGISIASLYLISKTIHLLMLGFALTLASFTYLALKNQEPVPDILIPKSMKFSFEIIFFSLFSMSLLILHFNNDRPALYFFIMGLSTGFLALSILQVASKFDIVVQIAKIFMISFNIKYSIFYNFEGFGVDYWTHLSINNILSREGFIETLPGKEHFFPLMHIQTAIHQIITNIPIKDATNFGIIIPFVILSLFVFFVARKLFDEKTGLLAMLLINITDFHVYWGAAPQTTTFGICLFFVLIYAIIQTATTINKKNIWMTITYLLILSLILSHAVSSFIMLITIIGLVFGSYLYRSILNNSENKGVPIVILLLSVIILIQHWFIAVYNDRHEDSFFEVILSTLKLYVTEHADFLNRPEAIAKYAVKLPPLIEQAADTLGLTLLMYLAAIGCFFWLSRKSRNIYTFSIIICTILLLLITFGFPLFGIRNIIPTRWFAFMYFFLTIMASYAVLHILVKSPKNGLKTLFVFFIMMSLTFFMTASTIANQDNPLWKKDATISTVYTVQEVKGTETLIRYSNTVFSDQRYGGSVITGYYGIQTRSLHSIDLSDRRGDLFVWRISMQDKPIRLFTTVKDYYQPVEMPTVLGEDFLKKLSKMDKLYYNGDISGYLIH